MGVEEGSVAEVRETGETHHTSRNNRNWRKKRQSRKNKKGKNNNKKIRKGETCESVFRSCFFSEDVFLPPSLFLIDHVSRQHEKDRREILLRCERGPHSAPANFGNPRELGDSPAHKWVSARRRSRRADGALFPNRKRKGVQTARPPKVFPEDTFRKMPIAEGEKGFQSPFPIGDPSAYHQGIAKGNQIQLQLALRSRSLPSSVSAPFGRA